MPHYVAGPAVPPLPSHCVLCLVLGLSLDACVELRENGQLKRVDDSCATASKGGAKRRGRRGQGPEPDTAGPEQVGKRQ